MQPAVSSAFDVAFWFADTALNDNEYLQPQKMQRLLFLSQAYFAVAYNGRILMPAVFVADEMGPVEPNVYVAFSRGRPNVEVEMFLDPDVEQFLDSIWRRFGHFSAERLTKVIKQSEAFRQAFKRGRRSVITTDAMRLAFTRAEDTPGVETVVKPKLMRSSSGKAVAVKAWAPRSVAQFKSKTESKAKALASVKSDKPKPAIFRSMDAEPREGGDGEPAIRRWVPGAAKPVRK